MRVTVTFWNQWIKPRKEQTADDTHSLYFGFGRLTWRRPFDLASVDEGKAWATRMRSLGDDAGAGLSSTQGDGSDRQKGT